jgi:GH43 family beta-xylosidase
MNFFVQSLGFGISFLILAASSRNVEPSSERAIYNNPVLDFGAADPFVTLQEGFYYLILSINGELVIFKSRELTNFRNAETKVIYRLPAGKGQLWAPEIHFVGGIWYSYFAMGDANYVPSNRLWAIKSEDADAFGNWSSEASR